MAPGDPNLLAEKIELILTNEDLSERISENARNFFLNELSYKKLPSYVQYFESL